MRNIAVFVFFFSSSIFGQQAKPSTVCAVLTQLRELGETEIEVRGVIGTSREVFALSGLDCRGTLITDGVPWPRALWLSTPGSDPTLTETGPDTASLRTLMDSVRKNPSGTVWVTIRGNLIIREAYRLARLSDGSLRGNGFGHLNYYPAELVIRSASDIEVRPVRDAAPRNAK